MGDYRREPRVRDLMEEIREQLADLKASILHRGIRTGDLVPTAAASAGKGYLLCDHGKHSKTVYPKLYAVILDTYNVGDEGPDEFRVPNASGRSLIGPGSGYNLGDLGGEESVALSESEIPSHDHGLAFNVDATLGTEAGMVTGAGTDTSTGSAGGGQAHNNMPPYAVVNWKIKT